MVSDTLPPSPPLLSTPAAGYLIKQPLETHAPILTSDLLSVFFGLLSVKPEAGCEVVKTSLDQQLGRVASQMESLTISMPCCCHVIGW